jgi:hypothetical protein
MATVPRRMPADKVPRELHNATASSPRPEGRFRFSRGSQNRAALRAAAKRAEGRRGRSSATFPCAHQLFPVRKEVSFRMYL